MFYLNTFFIFSILGYFFEILISIIEQNPKNTLLKGPWMPIYGIGLLMVNGIDKTLIKFKINGKKKIILNFFISIIVLTILEETGGLLVEFFFKTSFWSYENFPLSIGPYINIFVSIIWGIMAMILEYLILPLLTPWIKKIPKWASILLLILFIIDNLFNFKRNLKLKLLQ